MFCHAEALKEEADEENVFNANKKKDSKLGLG